MATMGVKGFNTVLISNLWVWRVLIQLLRLLYGVKGFNTVFMSAIFKNDAINNNVCELIHISHMILYYLFFYEYIQIREFNLRNASNQKGVVQISAVIWGMEKWRHFMLDKKMTESLNFVAEVNEVVIRY